MELPAVPGARGGSRKVFPTGKDLGEAVWPQAQNKGKTDLRESWWQPRDHPRRGPTPLGICGHVAGLGCSSLLPIFPYRSCRWVNLRTAYVSVRSVFRVRTSTPRPWTPGPESGCSSSRAFSLTRSRRSERRSQARETRFAARSPAAPSPASCETLGTLLRLSECQWL